MAYRQFGPLEAMMHVQQQGEYGKQQGQQTRLGRLVSQGMSEPGGLSRIAPEVAKIDPNAAFALQDRESASMEKRREALTSRARILSSMPSQQRAQVWPSIKAELAAVDPELGAALPDMYDEAQFGPVIEQLAGMAGGGATGVQSTYVDAQGNRVAIMRDGSTQVLGQNDPGMSNQTISIPGPDGRPRQYTFNKRTGQYEPAGGGGQATAPQGAPAQDITAAIAASANQLIQRGVPPEQVDAWAQQQMVSNVPNGMGVSSPQGDIVPPPRAAPAAGGNPFVGRTPEEEAAAKEAATIDARLSRADQVAEADAAAARRKAEGEAQVKRESTARTKAPQINNVIRGISRIDQAMKALDGGLVNTGPLDQYAVSMTESGQELEAAVGAIKNDLLALTRVPGVGSQSDLEQRIADLKYPQLGFHPEVNRRNLEQLRAFIRDIEEAVGSSQQAAPAESAPSAGGRIRFDAQGNRI